MSDDEEYEIEIREVRRKKRTYRSKSSKSSEYERDLLRDEKTKHVAGPTESRAIDENELRQRLQSDPVIFQDDSESAPDSGKELSPGEQEIVDSLSEIGNRIIDELVIPYVKNHAWPVAKEKLSKLLGTKWSSTDEQASLENSELETRGAELNDDGCEGTPESNATALVVREPSIRLTQSQMMEVQLWLKRAEDYAELYRWLRDHAEVADEDRDPELEAAPSLAIEGRDDDLNDEHRQVINPFLQGESDRLSAEQLRASEVEKEN